MQKTDQDRQEEQNRWDDQKLEYERKIQELESQIEMLKNQSGDMVSLLQAKIKELNDTHERVKTEMQQSHELQRKEMNELFENTKTNIIQDYDRQLRELQQTMGDEYESMKNQLETQINDLLEQLRKERENSAGDAA